MNRSSIIVSIKQSALLLGFIIQFSFSFGQTWPIHIEAESYNQSSGTANVTCSESGQSLGFINKYDWAEYQVNLPKDSIYKVSIRIAGCAGEVWIADSVFNVFGSIAYPYTSTDQHYTTVSKMMFLKGGNRKLRIQLRSDKTYTNYTQLCKEGANINWIEIEPSAGLYKACYFESDWEWALGSNAPWKACRTDSLWAGWIKQTARPTSLQLDNSKSKSGSSARFELSKSDSSTWPYLRSEIYVGPVKSQEMWFGFSTYSPTDVSEDGLDHILFQLHGTDDACDGGGKSPCIALRVNQGDSFAVKVLWASGHCTTDATKDGEISYTCGEFNQNSWDDWVFHVKFAYDNTGILEVWRNGSKVVNRINLPNAYNDDYLPYPKFGIYKWGWTNPWFSYSPYNTLVFYFDNLKIGGPNSNYNEVAP